MKNLRVDQIKQRGGQVGGLGTLPTASPLSANPQFEVPQYSTEGFDAGQLESIRVLNQIAQAEAQEYRKELLAAQEKEAALKLNTKFNVEVHNTRQQEIMNQVADEYDISAADYHALDTGNAYAMKDWNRRNEKAYYDPRTQKVLGEVNVANKAYETAMGMLVDDEKWTYRAEAWLPYLSGELTDLGMLRPDLYHKKKVPAQVSANFTPTAPVLTDYANLNLEEGSPDLPMLYAAEEARLYQENPQAAIQRGLLDETGHLTALGQSQILAQAKIAQRKPAAKTEGLTYKDILAGSEGDTDFLTTYITGGGDLNDIAAFSKAHTEFKAKEEQAKAKKAEAEPFMVGRSEVSRRGNSLAAQLRSFGVNVEDYRPDIENIAAKEPDDVKVKDVVNILAQGLDISKINTVQDYNRLATALGVSQIGKFDGGDFLVKKSPELEAALNTNTLGIDIQFTMRELGELANRLGGKTQLPAEVKGESDLGFRNNNPLNLRDTTSGEFKKFDSPEMGFEAAVKDLKGKISGKSPALNAYLKSVGKTFETATIADLISVWAPPSENNTEGYIEHMNSFMPSTTLLKDIPAADVENLALHMMRIESPDSYNYFAVKPAPKTQTPPVSTPAKTLKDIGF